MRWRTPTHRLIGTRCLVLCTFSSTLRVSPFTAGAALVEDHCCLGRTPATAAGCNIDACCVPATAKLLLALLLSKRAELDSMVPQVPAVLPSSAHTHCINTREILVRACLIVMHPAALSFCRYQGWVVVFFHGCPRQTLLLRRRPPRTVLLTTA